MKYVQSIAEICEKGVRVGGKLSLSLVIHVHMLGSLMGESLLKVGMKVKYLLNLLQE